MTTAPKSRRCTRPTPRSTCRTHDASRRPGPGAAAQVSLAGRHRANRRGSQPGQQQRAVLVLGEAGQTAGAVLLPARPVRHQRRYGRSFPSNRSGSSMHWASRRSTRHYSTPVHSRSARDGCGSRPRLPGPTGELTRVMIVNEARGWVLKQHLYDGRRMPIATALASGHVRDPLSQRPVSAAECEDSVAGNAVRDDDRNAKCRGQPIGRRSREAPHCPRIRA